MVSDAGPVIHLDEIGCLDLLADFGAVLVPSEVWVEIAKHRPGLQPDMIACLRIVSEDASPSPELVTLARSLSLDRGEFVAMALMQSHGADLFLCDDSAARLAAESLGFQVHGTLGILIRGVRRGLRSREQLLTLLAELPQRSSLHLSRRLLDKVIETVRVS